MCDTETSMGEKFLMYGAGHGSFGCDDCIPDDVNHVKYVRDLYELSKGQTGAALFSSCYLLSSDDTT